MKHTDAQKKAMIDAELAKVRWGEWVLSTADIGNTYYDGIEITANELVVGDDGGIDYCQDTTTPHMISVYLHLTEGGVESAVDYPPEQRHIAEALAIGLMTKYPNLREYPPDGLEQYACSNPRYDVTGDDWENARAFFGLDDSFQYSPAQQRAYIRQWKTQGMNVWLSMPEFHTVVAALRCWQQESAQHPELEDVATDGGTVKLMTDAEINTLIEEMLQ